MRASESFAPRANAVMSRRRLSEAEADAGGDGSRGLDSVIGLRYRSRDSARRERCPAQALTLPRLRYSCAMSVDFTAVFKSVPEGFIAFVEELPGATPRAPRSKRPAKTCRRPSRSSSRRIGRWRKRTSRIRPSSGALPAFRVKRADLVRHLEQHGCQLLREGGSHSVFVNREERKASTVPRHRELNDYRWRKPRSTAIRRSGA